MTDDHPVPVSRAMALPAHLLDVLREADPARLRPGVVLYVHLHQAALGATPGQGAAARVEGLGAHGLMQVNDLLRHAHVRVTPVLDLAERLSTNAYEFPERYRERIHLLHPAEMFPHATLKSRCVDLDHTTAYQRHGPPGQTGVFTAQPLGRTHHRAKTHLGYTLTTLADGAVTWRTPHGLHRTVDHTGTHLGTRDDTRIDGPVDP